MARILLIEDDPNAREMLRFRLQKEKYEVIEAEDGDKGWDLALRLPNLLADEGYENKPETEGRRPSMKEGEPCRKCSTPVIKMTSQKKSKGDFYYEFHLLCLNPACKTSYTIEEAKRFVAQPPVLL